MAPRRADGGLSAAPGRGGGRPAQVIATTMRLIARDGVAALSTRTIAREAAISPATLHSLFGSKDDLLLATLDAATSRMIATLVADAHPGGGLRAALAESFTALCSLLDHVPALPLVRCEVLLYSGRPAQAACAFQQRRYLDALQACYRVACMEGERCLMSSDDLAVVVGSSIDGLAMQTAACVPVPQLAAIRDHVLRALLALVQMPPIPPHGRDQRGTDELLKTLLEAERSHEEGRERTDR
jgi:AcrR family transcriptional regulator